MAKQPFTRSGRMRNIEWCTQLPRHEIFDAIYVRSGNRLWTQPSTNLNNALRRALMEVVARQPWRRTLHAKADQQ